jgi:hypothetical protein
MVEVTKPVALNESLNTTDSTPKNIADVLKDKLGDIASAISGGGGSGGHTIQNASGTNMPQEPTMQFTDSHVSDDSTNEKTVIENIKSVTETQFESATEDGLYDVDVEGAEIGEISEDYVEVTADGNKTYAQLLNELYADADLIKANGSTTRLIIGVSIFNIFGLSNYECYFSAASLNGQLPATEEIRVSSSSYYNRYRQGQFSDLSSTKPTSGTKITLYYGTDKAVVDLQTTANRCLMSDGTSLQIKTKTLTNPTCASNGAIETDLSSDKIIVSVFADIQVAHVYLGGVYDGKYYLQSANFSTGSINKSTTLSGNVTIQYFG